MVMEGREYAEYVRNIIKLRTEDTRRVTSDTIIHHIGMTGLMALIEYGFLDFHDDIAGDRYYVIK